MCLCFWAMPNILRCYDFWFPSQYHCQLWWCINSKQICFQRHVRNAICNSYFSFYFIKNDSFVCYLLKLTTRPLVLSFSFTLANTEVHEEIGHVEEEGGDKEGGGKVKAGRFDCVSPKLMSNLTTSSEWQWDYLVNSTVFNLVNCLNISLVIKTK